MRKVTFGSLNSEGKHYINICHINNKKTKFEMMIDPENFAGVEIGLQQVKRPVLRKKAIPPTYIAIILKRDVVVLHIEQDKRREWQKTICNALDHKGSWNGTLVRQQWEMNGSLQLMNSVISLIDKTSEPRCYKWWRICDLEKICMVEGNRLMLRHKRDGVIEFQPEKDLRIIYEHLKICAQENNINIEEPSSPVYVNDDALLEETEQCTKQQDIYEPFSTISNKDEESQPSTPPPPFHCKLRRTSSVFVPDLQEIPHVQTKWNRKKSIKGNPIQITPSFTITDTIPIDTTLPIDAISPIDITTPVNTLLVPYPEEPGSLSRPISDPNIYYNHFAFTTEYYNRQNSDIPTSKPPTCSPPTCRPPTCRPPTCRPPSCKPPSYMSPCASTESIEKFYEGEYDYLSPVMSFIYYYLCKRKDDTVENQLGISGITRKKLGLRLFNVSMPETGSWKDLASELCAMSVKDADYFSCLRQQQLCTQGLTETEMILKYWEHMASTDHPEYRKTFKYDCNRSELISLLKYLERFDLAELIQRSVVR